MSPTVSIILPFRNAANTIETAISSILDQTFRDFELLLIDNDSLDDSSVVASNFQKDTRVRIFTEIQIGVVHAANRGITESKGQYVARMDADDWSYLDRLENQVRLLNSKPEIGVVSGLVEPMTQPTEGLQKYLDWVNQVISPEEVSLNQFVEFPLVNPSTMMRKELFNQYGYFQDGDFPEDYEFFLRLCSNGVKMSKVDVPVLKWNDLSTRLTRTHFSYSEEAFNKVKTEYLAKWLKSINLTLFNRIFFK